MLQVADAHAHLSELQNLDAVIRRAAQSGLFAITSMGMDVKSNLKTLQLSKDYETSSVKVLPALGLHPWGLVETSIEPTIAQIRQNIDRIAGVGEVGLDYWLKGIKKDPSIKQVQRSAFKDAIMVAKESDKPITVHSRGAWADCFDMVVELGAKKVIFHWFSGPTELLKKIVDQGFYISATPAIEYSKDHRTAVLNVPLENLLLETDSPVKYGDISSEPKDVLIPLKEVCKLKGLAMEDVAEKTTENFSRIYQSYL
jgi:TatD DNase family protein